MSRPHAIDLNASLIAAVQKGDPEGARELLALGADPNTTLPWDSPLEVIDTGGKRPRRVLHLAATLGHAMICDLLIAAGADLAAPDPWGEASLHLAARGGHTDTCLALIRHGIAPDHPNPMGQTALHLAAREGRRLTIAALLAVGARPDPRDLLDRTPLHFAAEDGRDDACIALIALGATPNAQDAFGFTPLHRAAQNGHLQTCTFLLALGADPTVATPQGHIPAAVAQRRHPQLAALLRQAAQETRHRRWTAFRSTILSVHSSTPPPL